MLVASVAYASDPVQYEFTNHDSWYSFRGWFCVDGECEGLLELLFDYENVELYAGRASEIERGASGDEWYDLTYTYRRLAILENVSTWHRTLNRDSRRVEFELVASTNNVNFMPTVLSSRGYLLVIPQGQGCLIEYSQESTLAAGVSTGLYIRLARREAVAFLSELRSFVLAQPGLTR